MNEAEIKAQKDAARIVRVTNPFDFDYTHAWGGVPYTLPMGKPQLFPFPLADHLATHLARQALIRKAPMRDANETDGKGKDRPLWSDEAILEIKKTIMHEEYTEESKAPVSESEIMRKKIEELNKAFSDLSAKVDGNSVNVSVEEPVVPATVEEALAQAGLPDVVGTSTDTTKVEVEEPIEYKDKAEVIEELTKRGIKFDARRGKTELEKLLK